MRRRTLGVTSFTGLFATAACGIRVRQPAAEPSQRATAAPEPARIDVDAAFAAVQAGRATLVDVRGPESFQSRRAAGAILITLDELERSVPAALAKLPAGKQPILYCT